MTKASILMWQTGLGGGGPWVHCSCDKDHSLPEDSDFEDSFYYIELDGQLFVEDCVGCQTRLGRYETFIWENRNFIRTYLKDRIDTDKKRLEKDLELNDF